MQLDYQKELTPVIYGESAVKVLHFKYNTGDFVCFDTHWHERMELLLVRFGSLKVKIGDAEYTAYPGRTVIIPPEYPHRGITGADGAEFSTLMFDITYFYNSTRAVRNFLYPIVEQSVDFAPLTDDKYTEQLFTDILDENIKSDEFSALTIVGKVYELLACIYRCCKCGERQKKLDGKLKTITEYIEKHYCENISSAVISKRFGYDEAYFCRKFKSVTGLTPMNYIKILRIEKSREMIGKGETDISRIAVLCGFSDSGYFSRCFKKHYNLSPSEYIKVFLKSCSND